MHVQPNCNGNCYQVCRNQETSFLLSYSLKENMPKMPCRETFSIGCKNEHN